MKSGWIGVGIVGIAMAPHIVGCGTEAGAPRGADAVDASGEASWEDAWNGDAPDASSNDADATLEQDAPDGAGGGYPDTWATVDAGTFMMGSPDGEPGRAVEEILHEVTLTRSFLIRTTEVTQDEWIAVMGSNPASAAACGLACPVEQVSWFDAILYCNELSRREGRTRCYKDPDDNTDYAADDAMAGKSPTWPLRSDCPGYRLPTEAEWEYAARSGSSTAFFAGPVTLADPLSCDIEPNLDAAGWYCGNSGDTIHQVAEKQANSWGLFDVYGNTWEWAWDSYADYGGDATDPTGPTGGSQRVLRGGAYYYPAGGCRSATRFSMDASTANDSTGFRPVRSLVSDTGDNPWVPITSGTQDTLLGVWGSGPSDVWAVGSQGLGGEVIHWNGLVWQDVPGAFSNPVHAVWGSASDDVFAVGLDGVYHWNGSAWTDMANTTTLGGCSSAFYDVWGSSASDVWAVGFSINPHWDGTAWDCTQSPPDWDVYFAVWGAGSSDVWAVGDGASVHWDGGGWQSVDSGTTNFLRSLWGTGSNDIWSVGDAGTILHWNGVAWTPVDSGTPHRLWGVWGSAADDIWAVGDAGTLLHWNGSAWATRTSGTSAALYGVWGSGSADIWAVGEWGTVLHYQP